MSVSQQAVPSLFRFEDKKSVRVVEINGALNFVAKDVAEALDYTWNGAAAISHVPEQWKGVSSVLTPGGAQDMAVLAEQGLYFFLGRSDKPKALPFQMWIAGDVMPSIRKTGSYTAPVVAVTPNFADEIEAAYAWIAAKKEAREEAARADQEAAKAARLEYQVAELAPAAAGLDLIAGADGTMCITDAAKTLQMQPYKLRDALLEMKWMYRRQGKGGYVAYQPTIHSGYMVHKVANYQDPETGEKKSNAQVLVTRKGLAKLAMLLSVPAPPPSPRPHQLN
jgi:anti-repressor protein